jgi:hypothetical protein
MLKRREAAEPAQITFTSDFHELVTGDLRPGHPVVLSYDPFRIVPKGDPYVFGDPARPVIGSVQFRNGEAPLTLALHSPGGIIHHPDRDRSGQGSMLTARFIVPADADRISVWFSFVSASGEVVYDSDYGANFNFSFAGRDVAVLSATVDRATAPGPSSFSIRVATAGEIEAVSVGYHRAGDLAGRGGEVRLAKKTDEMDPQGRSIWSITGVAVPNSAVLRFKVYYWIRGRRFKDDNSGHYYLAPQPKPEHIPPPPPELAKAARAWK